MQVKIKAHYLPYYQEDIAQGKIRLLITDVESRNKIKNTTESLCGENARSPLKWHKKDCTLEAKVSDVAMFMKENQACAQIDLLGLEVEVRLELRKYSFSSKYEHNRGEKIQGASAVIKSICVNVL